MLWTPLYVTTHVEKQKMLNIVYKYGHLRGVCHQLESRTTSLESLESWNITGILES